MSNSVADFPVESLTVPERLALLARLWDSLLADNSPPPIPEWHREELARRIERADANPEASIPLEQLRRELKAKRP